MEPTTLGWRKLLVLVAVVGLMGSRGNAGLLASDGDPPRVLLLGDSISLGYTPFVQEMLGEAAQVVRPKVDGRDENCQGTNHGLGQLERWLNAAENPHVIVFNFGLHDMKHVDPATGAPSNDPRHPRQAAPQIYRQQLQAIAERLVQTGAHVVFATTTPVPAGGVRPLRRVGDPLLYNGLARQVVEPLGIQVVDLWSTANEHLGEWQQPVNVHFRPEGSRGLAAAVVQAVRPLLDKPRPRHATSPWAADPAQVAKLSQGGDTNYSESQVPSYELPALWLGDAEAPTAEEWRGRREALIEHFRRSMYGRVPAAASRVQFEFVPTREEPELCAGTILGRTVSIQITGVDPAGESLVFSFPLHLYVPRGQAPAPVMLLIHNREFPELADLTTRPDEFLPVELLCEYGFAVAVFHTGDVEPDRGDGRAVGIRGFFDRLGEDTSGRSDDWGALSAWAWGASRVLDYLHTEPAVAADRVCVVGHSRGGKTALWAAAQDERFAAAISNESGCGGAALSRRQFGERIGRIGEVFPFWFCPAFRKFAGRENDLPVDQHQLVALLAPRPVYVASASQDLWADPRGEYLALVAAAPAFRWTGSEGWDRPQMPAAGESVARGHTGYHVRPGAHDLTAGDWVRFVEFMKTRLDPSPARQ